MSVLRSIDQRSSAIVDEWIRLVEIPAPSRKRLNHPLVQTALAVSNHFRKAGTPAIVPADVGSTDANNAVALG